MRKETSILYVAYPLLPVSDESCGGAEQMLSTLESQMARRGYRTVMAACAGSLVEGELLCTGPSASETDGFEKRDAQHQRAVLDFLRRGRDSRMDLVHDKSGSFWQSAGQIDLPVLATLHLPRGFYPAEAFRYAPPNLLFNCVSEAQSQSFADLTNMVGVVRNGITVSRFPFVTEKQGYLLWMGRICEEKGPHLAIEVARRTGMPLILAGQVYPFSYHEQFYIREIRPYLGSNDPAVCFMETPNFYTKRRLLSEARAVLIPSLVEETSSLVAMEAMACGTPVIGFRRGAIPEVAVDGETGFVVDDVETMVEAVWRVGEINPHACRVHVEAHYSSERMADEYEALYGHMLGIAEPRNSLYAA
jgi:glycosyltransferase involved in cell wall biosynthesis